MDVILGEGGSGGAELRLVEIGLEAGFEDVKGCCKGCCCHATDTGEVGGLVSAFDARKGASSSSFLNKTCPKGRGAMSYAPATK